MCIRDRVKEEEVVVPSKEPVSVPVPPSPSPKMVDMPSPLPDMAEKQFSMFDSGMNLGSMDLTNDGEIIMC